MSDVIIYGEHTRVNIDHNNVTLDKGSGIDPPIVYTDRAHNSNAGDFSTIVSISHNRFIGSPAVADPEAVYMARFVLTGDSVYNVSHNLIDVSGADVLMSLNGQIGLYGNAGGTPQINTRTGGWVLNDNSRLWIHANDLHRSDGAVPNRPFFQLDFRFFIAGHLSCLFNF